MPKDTGDRQTADAGGGFREIESLEKTSLSHSEQLLGVSKRLGLARISYSRKAEIL
jgi:hypothetical protein